MPVKKCLEEERMDIEISPDLDDLQIIDRESLDRECPVPDCFWQKKNILDGPMPIKFVVNFVKMETVAGDYVDEFSSIIFEVMDNGNSDMYVKYYEFIMEQ